MNNQLSSFFSRVCKAESVNDVIESEFEKMVKDLGLQYVRNDHTALSAGDGGSWQELDFYFPEIKFAVEINGIMHYEPVYGEDVLAAQKARDKRKKDRCKKLGIQLRVVKPGNCSAGEYVPRFRRVIWVIGRRSKCVSISAQQ